MKTIPNQSAEPAMDINIYDPAGMNFTFLIIAWHADIMKGIMLDSPEDKIVQHSTYSSNKSVMQQ